VLDLAAGGGRHTRLLRARGFAVTAVDRDVEALRRRFADDVLYETFMLGNERFGRPSNPDFLLRPGELLEAFGSALTVVAFEQGIVDQPRPAAIQRIAAVKAKEAPLPGWTTPPPATS
jgi:hypothetical protein